MKIFLFNDSRSQNNWGCRATTNALLGMLNRHEHEVVGLFALERLTSLKQSPLNVITKHLLRSTPLLYKSVRSTAWAVKKRLGASSEFVTDIAGFEKLADLILHGKIWQKDLPRMLESDVFLVNGEGSIYGKEVKGYLTLFACWFAKTRLNKICALVNHTADYTDDRMRALGKTVLPLLDDVTFREPISYRKYAVFAPQVSEGFVPDAAFIHKPLTRAELCRLTVMDGSLDFWPYSSKNFQPTEPYVCILGSSALGRPEHGNRFPLGDFSKLISEVKRTISQVVLVASDTTDEAPFCTLAKEHNLAFFPAMVPTIIGSSILANAECLIGGRWHPSILGARGGTPSIMMTANTTKTTALLEMLGLETETFDASNPAKQLVRIVDRLRNYLQAGQTLRKSIEEKAIEFASLANENIRVCKWVN